MKYNKTRSKNKLDHFPQVSLPKKIVCVCVCVCVCVHARACALHFGASSMYMLWFCISCENQKLQDPCWACAEDSFQLAILVN